MGPFGSHHTVIFATHWSGTPSDVGHAWSAVEYPKGHWTVRGFYPKDFYFGLLTGTPFSSVINGQAGLIKDDFHAFAEGNLRTRTFRDRTVDQARAGLRKMFEYGASANKPAHSAGPPRKQHKRASSHPAHVPERDQNSTFRYGLLTNQCAVFAMEVIRAAGVHRGTLNLPLIPQAPAYLWKILGQRGEDDAAQLPKPFGHFNF